MSRLDHDSPINASYIAGTTGVHHHVQLLVEMGSRELSAWAGLQWQSS
jgi:hypothetical protein